MPPKKKNLAETLAALRAEKGGPKIGTLEDFDMVPKGMSTGNISLDALTGIGGYPRGRITEQFGPPSSGKTTSALQALALEQQRIISGEITGYVGFWDYEVSLDADYCRALGLDVGDESFIYLQPKTFEEGANVYRKLLETGELRAAVFDSVATMVTQNELDAETGAAKVADRAKMLHQFCRQVKGDLREKDSALIFLNHTMPLVDATPMGQKLAARGIKRMTQPGGTALPFYSSLRIEFKQIGNLRSTEDDLLTGGRVDQIRQTKVQATVVKNKVGDPFGTAELRVRFGRGFSQAFSALSILSGYGVVKRDGAGQYYFTEDLIPASGLISGKPAKLVGGELKVKGEDTTLEKIEQDPAWQALLVARAQALLDQHGVDKSDTADLYDSDGQLSDDAISSLLEDGETLDESTGEIK